MHRKLLTLATAATAALTPQQAAAAQTRPNIIVILADDLGWGDLGCYPKGAAWGEDARVRTPNLDALAAAGVRCTNAYATGMVCAPSRAGLITGQYQQHFGYYVFGETTVSFPKTVRTLPEILRQAGYSTALVGKWHVSSAPDSGPLQRGFDRFYGFIGGQHDYYEPNLGEAKPGIGNAPDAWVYDQDKPVKTNRYLTEEFTDRAIDFIDQSAAQQKPFFLYLAYNAPHTPLQVPWKYLEPYVKAREQREGPQKKYVPRDIARAMIHCLDDNIGRLLQHLNQHQLADNTLVIFSSDNGGSDGGPNTPRNNRSVLQHNGGLKGRKGTFYEGGIRVPMILRLPQKLPAGTTYENPVTHLDIYPTALALAKLPADKLPPQKLSGQNLIPYLNNENKNAPHTILNWTIESSRHWAVREGDWKLILDDTHPETLGNKKNRKSEYKLQLYNLAADRNETADLIDTHPEIAARLQKRHDAFVAASAPSIYTSGAQKAHRQFIADRPPGSRLGNQPTATGSPGHWQGADAARRSAKENETPE